MGPAASAPGCRRRPTVDRTGPGPCPNPNRAGKAVPHVSALGFGVQGSTDRVLVELVDDAPSDDAGCVHDTADRRQPHDFWAG